MSRQQILTILLPISVLRERFGLRLQANAERDPKKQKALIEEADRLRNRALELQKTQAASGK